MGVFEGPGSCGAVHFCPKLTFDVEKIASTKATDRLLSTFQSENMVDRYSAKELDLVLEVFEFEGTESNGGVCFCPSFSLAKRA